MSCVLTTLVGRSLAVSLLGLLVACRAEEPPDARPLVIVSVAPQRFVVKGVAEELVRVEVLIPPGANPRTHEPSIGQLRALEEAVLYVKVGHANFPFERAWLNRMLEEVPDLPVVNASRGLTVHAGDPHVWLAPRHVENMAIQTTSALEQILPEHRDRLRSNLAAFRGRVDALDREIEALLGGLEGKAFFVFHPAWGYFAEAYGLQQVAIERDHKEPGAHELAEVIERANEAQARVIFVQPQFDPASARTVAQETGARIETLDPLAEDWDANLRRAARALADGLSP